VPHTRTPPGGSARHSRRHAAPTFEGRKRREVAVASAFVCYQHRCSDTRLFTSVMLPRRCCDTRLFTSVMLPRRCCDTRIFTSVMLPT
jgi:hypothetical protein